MSSNCVGANRIVVSNADEGQRSRLTESGDFVDGYPHQLRGAGSQRLPGSEVKVSGHAALNTDSVSSTVVGKRATQIVLPAAKDALQQASGRIVQSLAPFRMTPNHLLIYYGYTLHLKPPSKKTVLVFRTLQSGNFWPSDGTKVTRFFWSTPPLSSSALNCFLELPRPIS